MSSTAAFDSNLTSQMLQAQANMMAGGARKTRSPEAVDEAAKDFEAMFLTQMLEPMFEGVHFGTDEKESEESTYEIYRSMLVNEYGKLMTQAGGIGVADYVKRAMLSAQEVKP